jgi:hypothetical protein
MSAVISLRRLAVTPRGSVVAGQYARGAVRAFATEKEIALRISATKNIQKITSAMKMVSTAKFNQDKNRLEHGRPFAEYLSSIAPAREELDENDFKFLENSSSPLFVCLTSDKGLCGGVNSFITRAMRKVMAHCAEEGKSPKIFVVGDKGRTQMRRIFPDEMAGVATEVRRKAEGLIEPGPPSCFACRLARGSHLSSHVQARPPRARARSTVGSRQDTRSAPTTPLLSLSCHLVVAPPSTPRARLRSSRR